MQIELVRKQVLKGAFINLSLLIGVGFLFMLLSFQDTAITSDLAEAKSQLSSYTSRTIVSTEENEAIIKAISQYESLPDFRLLEPPTDTSERLMTVDRLRAALPVVEKMNAIYKIENVTDPQITAVTKDNPNLRTESIDVFTNTLVLEFKAISDEVALSYCKALIDNLPGHAALKDLELKTLELDINNAITSVKDIRSSLPKLVSAKATFVWRIFREPGQSNAGAANVP